MNFFVYERYSMINLYYLICKATQEDELARTLRISAEEAEYKVNEEEFKSICDMFPSFDKEVVRTSLIVNNGNKETTIEKLIEMS